LLECKKYLEGSNFNKPPLIIRDLGGRFDRVTQKIQFLKFFKDAVKRYIWSVVTPKSKLKLNARADYYYSVTPQGRTIKIQEKFSQDTDPIKDMGIGVKAIREFETVEEAAKTFVDNIYILSNGAIKSGEEYRRLQNNLDIGFLGDIHDASPLAVCKHFLDGTDLHQPPLLIHELGGRFDRVTQRVQFLKDFKTAVADYVRKNLD
jgi:hypothetical protein